MKGDPYEQLLRDVGRFIELQPSAISEASELGELVNEGVEKLRGAVKLKPRGRGELDRIAAKLRGVASRLSRSVSNSKRGAFRQDWSRFARSEVTRLKDEVLALREFLALNEKVIRRSLDMQSQGLALSELLDALHEANAIHEVTYARLTKRVAEMSRRELRRREREVGEQLARMSSWLSGLREVRQVKGDASKKR